MQYFKPEPPYFVGDCMPFFHDGVFHLYYLRDENHHHGLGGLGGHQWAHATSTDLIHWQHHPLALGIDTDWEKSICTGSVFHHAGVFYAFYATRFADRRERVCVARSEDSIHFAKAPSNPFLSPPNGYHPGHFRDPVVFRTEGDGDFHMLVTASLNASDAYGRGGCLAHFTSRDLEHWDERDPFLVPGYTGVPECPDYFEWNGWYYLLFSIDGVAHYRMSRQPLGPWLCPRVDTFDGPMARVMKTAAFGGNRRIGAAFLVSLQDQRDDGNWLYAGNVVFRELVQRPDGTLGARFVPEMLPHGVKVEHSITALTPHASIDKGSVRLSAQATYEEALINGMPRDVRVHTRITPQLPATRYGVGVRGGDDYRQRYEINILPAEQRVDLRKPDTGPFDERGGHTLHGVEGLDHPITLDIVLKDDIVDVCIDGRRCLVNRLPELQGQRLYLFCQHGEIVIDSIGIEHLG